MVACQDGLCGGCEGAACYKRSYMAVEYREYVFGVKENTLRHNKTLYVTDLSLMPQLAPFIVHGKLRKTFNFLLLS